jgi:oligoendopeptidase F
MTLGLRENLHVLTHTFNTVLADKMIEDRLRNYPSWISSMNLANELDDQTVEALVQAVTSKNQTVARFYRLKKRMLDVDRLLDYDRYAPLPFMPDDIVPWEQCRNTVLDAYKKFSPEMAGHAARFFDNNWIDAGVRQGKTSGAFAHPVVPSIHPYVLVNYTGNLRDVETLAHELGHGVHQILAAEKGYFNSDTPLTLAETASVFGEMLVFQDLVENLDSDRKRLGFVASKVESIFATVFRQVAMNRFEHAIHTFRREQGELSAEKFTELWLDTQQAMFGDSVVLSEDYGIWWSYISHFIHVPGYVYAYAFGELLVLSLYDIYIKMPVENRGEFVSRYMKLLAAGGSDTPYRLLQPFDIDLHDPEFWHQGLNMIDRMVDEVEELADLVM